MNEHLDINRVIITYEVYTSRCSPTHPYFFGRCVSIPQNLDADREKYHPLARQKERLRPPNFFQVYVLSMIIH